ncbi:MAG: hypothetical protein SVR94_06865 [Pseudomonadota bacterium]|nr:hypothetical protein [Pseudomonadota bacterium]
MRATLRAELEPQLKRLAEVIEVPLEHVQADLEQLFPQHPPQWQWLHLVELWDYWIERGA